MSLLEEPVPWGSWRMRRKSPEHAGEKGQHPGQEGNSFLGLKTDTDLQHHVKEQNEFKTKRQTPTISLRTSQIPEDREKSPKLTERNM